MPFGATVPGILITGLNSAARARPDVGKSGPTVSESEASSGSVPGRLRAVSIWRYPSRGRPLRKVVETGRSRKFYANVR